ncbi:tRNA (guanine(37)-N1)-methyltransferase [Araneus ventricosus]|uniref:tRNA (guanine(37)-N1)-methyltransferase n=1 Tax=Araneus ventricosus TaxID=182803 RepID=A0A4Y2LBP1_ARAVE|nr:tRNA (guanine(37)-N1)-methyltransferase [Araneus ventricosus]
MHVIFRVFRRILKVKFDCALTQSLHASSTHGKFPNISVKMSSDNQEGSQATSCITPPVEVRGMKVLNRDAFSKEINVPYILVPVEKIRDAVKFLKPCFLKMPNLQPVQEDGEEKKILLHPDLFDEKLLYLQKVLNKLSLSGVLWTKINLSYDNWTTDHILKAVLPLDSTGNVSSFSIVGHVIHINLKPDLMDFKHLIGQVLLDKHSSIKTVVNKAHIIENEFRNFSIELLAGEPKYEVLVKENNCQYAFDFSKVFWNPRLGHEHNEIVKRTTPGDFVYDVFAGVGPFAVPLAKKKCQVHANDLNPDSFKWLCHNATLNKVSQNLHCYNLDGKEFIQTVVKKGLAEFWNSDAEGNYFHILMNLPASALEFLESFEGLFTDEDLKNVGDMPIVYCYFFQRKDENVSDILGKYFDDETQKTLEITSVRLVAPNKMMMRVTYKIPRKILFLDSSEPPAKKSKLDEEDNETIHG